MIPIYQVDSFTTDAFSGNPAGVCLLDKPMPEDWMQDVAAEMNLAETAFLIPSGKSRFDLRWFTPEVEVDLCGHATLASAHVIYSRNSSVEDDPLTLDTKSGPLIVSRNVDGSLTMDFPATPPSESAVPESFEDVFGIRPTWFGRSRFDLFAEVSSESDVRSIVPDHPAIAALGARGIIVTAKANLGEPYNFVSRFFAPGSGVPEDPVTGSAHCALAPYWANRLSRNSLVGFQASSRGGFVRTAVKGDRVELTGNAVTVFQGSLLV